MQLSTTSLPQELNCILKNKFQQSFNSAGKKNISPLNVQCKRYITFSNDKKQTYFKKTDNYI